MDNYQWSWWLILTILSGLILGAITAGFFFWIIWVLNLGACIYHSK